MFSLFGKKNKKTIINKSDTSVQEKKDGIKLRTLLDLIKHGEEIGLNIKNEDLYEQGVLCARTRILDLGNVSILFSEWAEWTIEINVHENNKKFTVYHKKLKVDWDEETFNNSHDLEVQWNHVGEWCDYITSKINGLKSSLDKKRVEDKVKEENEKKDSWILV